MKSYYNTTNESGQTLIEFEAKAKTQDDRIIEVFLVNPKIKYGASDFTKTGEKQRGIYSRNEYTYILR